MNEPIDTLDSHTTAPGFDLTGSHATAHVLDTITGCVCVFRYVLATWVLATVLLRSVSDQAVKMVERVQLRVDHCPK